jgi:hypothetical protein
MIGVCMAERTENKCGSHRPSPPQSQLAGTLWFGGWLFTIAFAELSWWKAVLALLIWPYFVGASLR